MENLPSEDLQPALSQSGPLSHSHADQHPQAALSQSGHLSHSQNDQDPPLTQSGPTQSLAVSQLDILPDSHTCGQPTITSFTENVYSSNRQPIPPSHMGIQLVSRKRLERSSLIQSPMKLARSPSPKIKRRVCTGTEQSETTSDVLSSDSAGQTGNHIPSRSTHDQSTKSIADFQLRDSEKNAWTELNAYLVQKQALSTLELDKLFVNIQDYFGITRAAHIEKSNCQVQATMAGKWKKMPEFMKF